MNPSSVDAGGVQSIQMSDLNPQLPEMNRSPSLVSPHSNYLYSDSPSNPWHEPRREAPVLYIKRICSHQSVDIQEKCPFTVDC